MNPKIAYTLGWLQGWMGNPYHYNLVTSNNQLQTAWFAGYNNGRIKFLDEELAKNKDKQNAPQTKTA